MKMAAENERVLFRAIQTKQNKILKTKQSIKNIKKKISTSMKHNRINQRQSPPTDEGL